MSGRPASGSLVVRLATADDRPRLERLAQLDSAPPPIGDHLVAEEDGELRAAVPLHGGRAFADPFRRTRGLLAILALRAADLAPAGSVERGIPRGLRAGGRREARLSRPLRPRTVLR